VNEYNEAGSAAFPDDARDPAACRVATL